MGKGGGWSPASAIITTVSSSCTSACILIFFFQAEDGIRDGTVTGVQTCALPISMRLERLPVGSRIVYPPPPLSGHADPQAAIAAALDNPLGMEPLDALLRPGMRLTIAFDDISLPLPQMRTPDMRQQVIEQVLERAYRAGVDDIHLIAALAVHRRIDRKSTRLNSSHS